MYVEITSYGDAAIIRRLSQRTLENSEKNKSFIGPVLYITELSTGRMDPRVGSGSGRVGSRFCRILAGRVGSGQHFRFFSFLLIISWYLNRYESSNTTFGLIDFYDI